MIEERDREDALRRVQLEMAAGRIHGAKSRCECGELIPAARQARVPGTRHCTPCAETLERKTRLYRPAA